MNRITPKEAYDKRQNCAEALLIDVRTPKEYKVKHVVGAVNIPLNDINCDCIKMLLDNKTDVPIMILCQSGTRSNMAFKKLDEECQANVLCVNGGTVAWEQEGLPVEKGACCQTMSVERQVRIVAGFLVVLGSVLGYFINPLYFIMSGFVGCGLMFAGVTDTCGMAAVLEGMPWNK
ncbi:MAG: rhodanese-like domain-containing protein [bacterium]